ncbi:MAG TPA: GNAT family protein, partial [Blastocatellia bacterium]|nr:GNAT family protein [Blastocatellia bacterium]
MKLLPLDTPELVFLAAEWLARKENYQWLDFGSIVTPALLKIMAQRDAHFLRVYTWGRDDRPIGIVGLNSVDRAFKTGTLWAVAGEKSFSNRGYVSLASSKLLTLAFRDLGLHVVDTWIVDRNPSVRSLERLNFRFIGRQRQCHHRRPAIRSSVVRSPRERAPGARRGPVASGGKSASPDGLRSSLSPTT